MSVTPLELAKVAAAAADSKKAYDISLLDLTELSDMCDYFLIASAMNAHQADAIVDEIEKKVRLNCGEDPISIEGRDGKHWILMDYGAVVIHIFDEETRRYYRLERLWGDAPKVDLGLDKDDAEKPEKAPAAL
ncbi:MAG: ribosome silencing factor [Atopobiaceae bacterium]